MDSDALTESQLKHFKESKEVELRISLCSIVKTKKFVMLYMIVFCHIFYSYYIANEYK